MLGKWDPRDPLVKGEWQSWGGWAWWVWTYSSGWNEWVPAYAHLVRCLADPLFHRLRIAINSIHRLFDLQTFDDETEFFLYSSAQMAYEGNSKSDWWHDSIPLFSSLASSIWKCSSCGA